MNRPTLPPPAMITRISALPPAAAASRAAWKSATASTATDDVQQVALLGDRVRRRHEGRAEPAEGDDAGLRRLLELAEALADPRLGDLPLDDAHLGRRVGPLGVGRIGQQPAHHLVGGPGDGRHGGEAEPLVDHGPAGVVDAGDDAVDAERLAGDAGDEHVGVVAVGHRGDGAGPLDPRLDQPVAVEADALHGRAGEVVGEATEGLGAAVDDRHGVPAGQQVERQRGAHPTAADDDDVHAATLGSSSLAGDNVRPAIGP